MNKTWPLIGAIAVLAAVVMILVGNTDSRPKPLALPEPQQAPQAQAPAPAHDHPHPHADVPAAVTDSVAVVDRVLRVGVPREPQPTRPRARVRDSSECHDSRSRRAWQVDDERRRQCVQRAQVTAVVSSLSDQ